MSLRRTLIKNIGLVSAGLTAISLLWQHSAALAQIVEPATGMVLDIDPEKATRTINSQARLIVPQQSEGWAEIPLLNSYPADKLLINKKARLRAQHNDKFIVFDLSMPIPEGYTPPSPSERDSLEILQKSGLKFEVILQPGKTGPYYYYGVNSAGTVYDAKGDDRSWNGKAVISTNLQKNKWELQLQIPRDDIGISSSAAPLGVSVLLENKSPADTFVVSWTAMRSEFTNPQTFGTIELAKDKPFVRSIELQPVQYTATGATMSAKYVIANSAAIDAVVGEGQAKVEVAAKSEVSHTQTLPLASQKLSGVTFALGDVFNYHHLVQNLLMPDIELVAQDLTRFRLNIRNKPFLSQYASNVKVALDGKELYNAPLAGIGERDFPIKGLAVGNHKLTAAFYSPAKTELSKAVVPFYVYDPPQLDNDISKFDFSRYYKPVTFAQGQLKSALAQFDLSQGVLPHQIAVKGKSILAAPISIRFNGQSIIDKSKTSITSQNKNRFTLKSNGVVGNTRTQIQAQHDYDGFTWYDVTLRGNGPLKYGPLEIVIPLKLAKDVVVMRSGPIHDVQLTKTGVAPGEYAKRYQGRSELMEGDTNEYPLTNVLSLGTDDNEEYRGLSFITEGPRGWNLKNYDRMYNVQRDANGNVTLTVRVSDGATAWTRDEIKFSFGLQPFPMRTYPQDAPHRLDNTFDPKNYKERYLEAKRTGKETFFQRVAKTGADTEVAFEYWTEHENYWKTELRDEDMQYYVRDAHENNMKVMAYFGFLISDTIPEFPLYHDLALTKPTSYPDGTDFNYYYHYKFGDPNQKSYGVCYNSFWRDTLLNGMDEATARYKFSGYYLDGTFGAATCTNAKHGCGIIDPYGRHIPSSAIRAIRGMSQHMFRIGQKHADDFQINLSTSMPAVPFMGLLTGFYVGETMHLFDPKYSRMEPGALRGWLNGRFYGVSGDLLLRPPYNQNVGWAQALLVDSQIRLAMGGGEIWTGLAKRMWKLDETYGMTDDTFTVFFSAKNKIKTDNPKVFVSYYDTPKALVAVVSNYMEETNQKITLDLSAFPELKNAIADDIWQNNEKLQITNGQLSTTVPRLNLRLLVIKKP